MRTGFRGDSNLSGYRDSRAVPPGFTTLVAVLGTAVAARDPVSGVSRLSLLDLD
ncbi:uncharacterized protein METZ01_LOCUS78324 [marine metagenome]|uniref:Uncharacterized protein n=1 Tax=marine metagenome TaxID=408172 RepID=A0A381UBA6_9ZZZZ